MTAYCQKAFTAVGTRVIDRARRVSIAAFALTLSTGALPAGERANYFDDPFLQVTRAIADCPKQEGSLITQAEMRAEAHERAERGTRCFESGRCRLPNSYLYDKEIILRVKKAILADGRFSESSVWVEGKRRWVWLKGCVRKRADSLALEQLVRSVDDVELVINQLVVRSR